MSGRSMIAWIGGAATLMALMTSMGFSEFRFATYPEHRGLAEASERMHVRMISQAQSDRAAALRVELRFQMYLLDSNEVEQRRYVRVGDEIPASSMRVKSFLEVRITEINRMLKALSDGPNE